MLQYSISLRKKVGEFTHRLEERTAQTPSFFVRLYLVATLFVMYMFLAVLYAVSVLLLSPQRVFETFQPMDPVKGYTVSYSQYRSRHRVAQLSVVSSTVVIVCITMLNGFLFSREQTFAANDLSFQTVTVSVPNELGAVVDQSYAFVTSSTIPVGTIIRFGLFPTSGGSSSSSGFDFSSAVLSSSDFSSGNFLPATDGSFGTISVAQDLPAGSYSFILLDVVNTSTAGSYKAGISTQELSPSANITYSDPFTMGDASEEEETTCSDALFGTVQAGAIGSSVYVIWDAYDTADTYTVRWQETADSEAQDQAEGVTDTSYLIEELTYNTSYQVYVTALISGCDEGVESEMITVKTHPKGVAQIKYSKPTIAKKAIKNTQATVKWKGSVAAKSYQIQLANSSGKMLKTYKVTKLKKMIVKLRPKTKYQVRVQATYSNGEKSAPSEFASFTTK